ncbi:MAG: transposase [Chitinophagaceae bacterium]|jgi:IS605 OrfB family transposase|nr:transposase [Chitinophagaceae bacterium]
MKLTLQIKLLPTKEQAKSLKQTIVEANTACNEISDRAWSKKVFNQFKLHKEVYHPIKSSFNLSAQMVVRCISKVCDAYKLDRKVKREFRLLGAITYDARILSYTKDGVSLWSVDGRLKGIKFVCHNPDYLPYIKGEADLVYKKGKFYLFQTVEVPEEDIDDVESFLGVDFGQTDIAVLSDGTNFNSEQLKKVRKKYSKVRASVQSKGTKGAKKLLKRLSGRERRFVSINNHYIAKQIVEKAVRENKGIAIEDLSNIRKTAKPKSKALKTELNRWSFYQLRQFLTYKAQLKGVKLFVIPPAYTSQMCADCFWIGERKGKRFSCKHCGCVADADHNAARNISTWGEVVNSPEKSDMFSCALHY